MTNAALPMLVLATLAEAAAVSPGRGIPRTLATERAAEVFAIVRQPQRQRRDQAFPAGLFGPLPDLFDDLPNGSVPGRGSAGRLARRLGQGLAQEFDGVLTTVVVLLAEVVEQLRFAVGVAARVARAPADELCLASQLGHLQASVGGVISL